MKVLLRCPSCHKQGRMEFADDSAKKTRKGLLAVNVAPNMICEHSFIAYLDKNLAVRNYFTADFEIEIPDQPLEQVSETDQLVSTDLIDLDLLRLNITPTLITWIIKSIFMKKQIIVISDQEFLYNHYINFFKFITQKSFGIDFKMLSIVDYIRINRNN